MLKTQKILRGKEQDINMRFEDVYNAFGALYSYIMDCGEIRGNTMAIYNIAFKIVDITRYANFPKCRKFKEDYAFYEWGWYLSGDRNIKEIGERAKIWKDIADEDGNVWSNYGWHWKENDQLNKIIELLKVDIMTRRAVVLHYDYNKLDEYGKDTPCNLVLHFQYIQDKLTLTIFSRSIDLVYGFSNDQYIFSKLLIKVAEGLKLDVGFIQFFISNLHIYKRHFKLCKSKYKEKKIKKS